MRRSIGRALGFFVLVASAASAQPDLVVSDITLASPPAAGVANVAF